MLICIHCLLRTRIGTGGSYEPASSESKSQYTWPTHTDPATTPTIQSKHTPAASSASNNNNTANSTTTTIALHDSLDRPKESTADIPATRKSTHPTTTDASNSNNNSGIKKVSRPHTAPTTTTNTKTTGTEVDDDKKNSSTYSYNKSDKANKMFVTPKKTPIRYVYYVYYVTLYIYTYTIYYAVLYICLHTH